MPEANIPKRHVRLLQYLADGLSYKQIGNSLGLSPATVETYARQMRKTLGVANNAQLVAVALGRGLLSANQPYAEG